MPDAGAGRAHRREAAARLPRPARQQARWPRTSAARRQSRRGKAPSRRAEPPTSRPAAPKSCGSTASARNSRRLAMLRAQPRRRRKEPQHDRTRTETDTFGPIEVPADRYWGAQTQRSLENFPHRHRAHAAAADPRARHRQARRGRDQPRARLARRPARRGHRRGRAGGDRRQARRPFPAGGLADRLRHPDQHERQRGDRQPRQRAARRQARREVAGASERPRQHEPVVERLLPDRDAHRGRRARSRSAARSGARAPAGRAAAQGEGVRGHRQDRPHASAGRDAAHARPGILRLRRAGRARHRPHRGSRSSSSIRWRRAAPRSAPGSTPSRNSRELFASEVAAITGCRSSPRRTSSRRWPRTTPMRSRTARSTRSRPACSRSPTTSACSAPARARASAS